MARPRKDQEGPTAVERMEEAFWEILAEKPYAQITVGEIAKRAQVNKNAFDYHFDGVGALAAHPGVKQASHVLQGPAVRRLTPLECERLQGFPDNWTNVEFRGKPAPDGRRYRALGNAMAVPVVKWIGERVEKAV